MMCDCYSYNWYVGSEPEVILEVPENLKAAIRRDTVCVDYCIVEKIKLLWACGIITHGSCCGHNKIPSSIILEDNASRDVINKAREIVGSSFELYYWSDADRNKITKVVR